MTTKMIEEMTGPELVAAFNDIATRSGGKPIKKFRTRADGLKRLKALLPPADDPVSQFMFRSGSPREKVLVALLDKINSMVPTTAIAKASGLDDKAVKTMIGGLLWRIKTSRLPYRVEKTRDGFGLYEGSSTTT